jgi:ubiquinone biosynthesis protein Coq4
MALLLPYSGDRADPALAARHEALGSLPARTLGRSYWEIYKKNGYAFPGDPKGVNAAFARPHDSTHVISGYDTTPAGEILVSTFTAGMHPKLPMEGHILPVLFSWHLGIEINTLAGSFRGALEPEQFWIAWTRGAGMTVDLFSSEWDFWSHVEEPVERLRQRYHVTA